jgi:hypothetical protein
MWKQRPNCTNSIFSLTWKYPAQILPEIFLMDSTENKYKEGETVFAKVNPELKLIIRRYVDRIYYCKVLDEPERKELVYFERELSKD